MGDLYSKGKTTILPFISKYEDIWEETANKYINGKEEDLE